MNYGTEPLSAALSPFLSGTSSPIPGGGFAVQQSNNGASSSQVPTSMAMMAALNAASTNNASPALAYANAQLAHFAQQHQQQQQQQQQQTANNSGSLTSMFQGQGNNANINAAHFASLFSQSNGGIPSHLQSQSLAAALTDYNASVPNSAASSPGAQYRRLPGGASGYPSGAMTGHNTPGGHSRVAASAITGKRLNWSEMICQTIAESESGRLVIQDLFEQMCAKFPEIHEWAFGKDWEARVKNRIKSTLSIKGNMFIKVPRPSSAAGKGSWWTLSQEAQDAWKEGRVASVIKSGTHSRSASQGRIALDNLSMSAATSRANSRAPSRAPSRRGSPVSSRGPSSHHAQSGNQHGHGAGQRHSQAYVNFGQQGQAQQQQQDGQSHSSPSVGSQSGDNSSRRQSPSSGLPASLGMSPINFSANSNNSSSSNNNTFDSLNLAPSLGFDSFDESHMQGSQDPNRMRMMENSVNDSFDPSAMTSGVQNGGLMQASGSMGMTSGNLYSISPYNAFSTSATAAHMGTLATAAHMGGPQSMPFPHSSNTSSDNADQQQQQAQAGMSNNLNAALTSFGGDPTFGAFAGLDLSSMDGLNNPFGSLAGGYTMLPDGNGGEAQPQPIPGRNGGQGGSGSGGRGTPGTSSSFNAAFYSGPSPADSTGSTSAFFAYTPAMQAADAAMGSSDAQVSALGPVGGEGSRKKRGDASSASVPSSDFALPPTAVSDKQ